MSLLHQLAIRSRMFLPSRMLRRLLQVLLKDQGQTILFSNSQKMAIKRLAQVTRKTPRNKMASYLVICHLFRKSLLKTPSN